MKFDINFDVNFYLNSYPKAKLFYYRFGEIGLKYHFLIYSKKLKIYNTTEPNKYIKYEIDSSINVDDAIIPENNNEIITPRKKKKCKTKIYYYKKNNNISSSNAVCSKINNQFSNEKNEEIDQSKFIVIRPINGIGNRLRSIISFKILTDYLKVPLYIYWGPSNGFDDTKWTDLFDFSSLVFLNFIDEKKWNYYRNLESTIDMDEHISFINDSNRCCDDISLEDILVNNSNKYDLSQITAISSIDLKYINNRIIYKYIPDYDNIYSNYFNKLILNKDLQNIVDKFLLSIPENTVGVHIRQGDFHHMNHIPIYKYYNSYKTQDYFDKLVADYINQNKYIYICTDTKSFLDRYINLYGDKIKYYNKVFVDSILNQSKNGQIDSIIELWIMRNLTEINTDELSSFGFHCKIKFYNSNSVKEVLEDYKHENPLVYTQKLSICLLCTTSEFIQNKLHKFIDNLTNFVISHSYKIDLLIFTNNNFELDKIITLFDSKLKSNININSIIYTNLDLNQSEDVYIKNNIGSINNSYLYGNSTGPNLMFIRTLLFLLNSNYDNILLLEWDVYPIKSYWLDSLINKIDNCNYIVMGSIYKGLADIKTPFYNSWNKHLNGVAIYNLMYLKDHINNFIIYFKNIVINLSENYTRSCQINYDIALYQYIRDNNLLDQYIDIDEIINISLDIDASLTKNDILTLFPNSFLIHQKV